MTRFDRNIRLFGLDGQRKLQKAKVAICGLGGVGSIVNQESVLLGVSDIAHIDPDYYSSSSRNRLVGFNSTDRLDGLPKTEIAKRLAESINPDIKITSVHDRLESADGIAAILRADWVFGCLDQDGSRFVMNEICVAYKKNFIDLATDVPENGVYGGRAFVSWQGRSCLFCKQLLDLDDVRRHLTSDRDLQLQDEIYGVSKELLDAAGPSVVSLNGVIASLGITEFMVAVTGMRPPVDLQTYRGDIARLTKDTSETDEDCPYCVGMWGIEDRANIQRYLEGAA